MKEETQPQDEIRAAFEDLKKRFEFETINDLLDAADRQHPGKLKFGSAQLYHACRNAQTVGASCQALREAVPAHVFSFIAMLKLGQESASLPRHYRLPIKRTQVFPGSPTAIAAG